MITASNRGQHELSRAWKGAIVGGLGGLFGAFAPAGILPGLVYGSASGAITGGLNLALFGDNVGRGALMGAFWGGIAGAINGGITAALGGGDVWTGKFPVHELPTEEVMSLGAMEGAKVEYSKDGLDSYMSKKFGKVNKLIKSSLDVPDGYTLNADKT